ncbi:MAG: hypothetical protein GX878_00840, partial [Firmicutes bacterium]|nr:hypothetical protein [Bacillota bacterium]
MKILKKEGSGMNFRRRSAPVSTLRTRLQQRLAEKNNWEYKNDFNLEEAKPDPGSLSPAAIFKTMHRYFLVKITVALIVVFVTALFIQGGQSSAE